MGKPGDPDRIDKLLRQQATLASFGSYAFRETDLQKVLTEAARACAEGLGVAFCKICRYRVAEDDLLIVAGQGWHDGVVGLVVSAANETSPQGRAYVSGLPVIIRDLRAANDYLFPPFYGEHGIVSTVDVLIKGVDGTPYGVLEIDSPVQQTYDHHDIDFLTGFANVLAEAVATGERNALLVRTVAAMEEVVAEKDKLLGERDVLAEELKHRVRNNLQLVHAMLASHLKLAVGAEAQTSMQGIIRRVVTLAEVYEQLLGTGLGKEVDLGAYLSALCGSLPRLQGLGHDRIRITCRTDTVRVDLDTVTAMGMVVAELVANSFDHAFPSGRGTVTVDLRRAAREDIATLTISDDGAGFAEQPGSKRHGVGLVRRLVEQVRGTDELRSRQAGGPGQPEHGTAWTLRFPVLPATPAPLAA